VLGYSEKCGVSMRKSKNQFEGAQLVSFTSPSLSHTSFSSEFSGMVRDAKEEC
jgi:hypothetical protein